MLYKKKQQHVFIMKNIIFKLTKTVERFLITNFFGMIEGCVGGTVVVRPPGAVVAGSLLVGSFSS